jgi:hypothetical protein
VLTLVTLLGAAAPAQGWGDKGHRVIGHLARDLLTPSARAAIVRLMGSDDLATFGLYLDEHVARLEQEIPGSRAWHYDNIPVCAPAIPAPPCPAGNCASSQIPRHRAILSDARESTEKKRFAVHVLGHLIADIHQPLHAGDNADRGGNDVKIRLPDGRIVSLHFVWDVTLVEQVLGGASDDHLARTLLTTYAGRAAEWRTGDAGAWITESNQSARSIAYGKLAGFACGSAPGATEIPLSSDYAQEAGQVVRELLAKAAYRLAHVLNSALGD